MSKNCTISRKNYVLSQDVKNPHPDKRCKNYWLKAEIWQKGMRFIVEEIDLGICFGVEEMKGKIGKRLSKVGSSSDNYEHNNKDLFAALIPFLAEEPESVQNIMEKNGFTYNSDDFSVRFAEKLIKDGKISLEDFKSYVVRIENDIQEDYEKESK